MTIEVPPRLFAEWWAEGVKQHGFGHNGLAAGLVARKAAEWAADQELDACFAWLHSRGLPNTAGQLHTAMRPKPPSLKEQALAQLEQLYNNHELSTDTDAIRRALESIPDADS